MNKYVERALSNVEKNDKGCWLWKGSLTVRGKYAQMNIRGRVVRVHRWLYQKLKKKVSRRLDLDHTCRVRHCINPEHLEPVTRKVNLARGVGGKPWSRCAQGHDVLGDNVYTRPGSGRKECFTCKRARRFAS